MRLITILSLICTLPFAGLSNNWAENAHLKSADSLRTAGRLKDAIVAYEYSAYTATSNVVRTIALLKKAECLVESGATERSESTLSRLNFYDLNDSLQYAARYHSALYSYLNKNFDESISQLRMIQQFLPLEQSIHSKPLFALALNETRNWSEAESQMKEWGNYNFSNDSVQMLAFNNQIEEAYQTKNHPKFKDPAKAQIWAQLLPGTGQLYSGYLFDAAFTSVMVLSGIGIAAYGIFIAKYYVTGALLGYGIFQRFYIAGQNRSEFLANKRNYKRKRAYNNSLRELIIDYSL